MRRCRLGRAEIHIKVLGDLNAPRYELLAAELDDRRGYHQSARAHLDVAVSTLQERRTAPSGLIHAAITAMATAAAAHEVGFCELLVHGLEQVDSGTHKLALLHPLREVHTALPGDREMRARLRAAVPAAASLSELDPRDRAVLSLADADLDRILGRSASARATLRAAARALVATNLTTSRRWLEGALSVEFLLEESDRLAFEVEAERTSRPLARAALMMLTAEAAAHS